MTQKNDIYTTGPLETRSEQKEQIPIFFTINESYAPFLGVALGSLTANASAEYRYRIIIIEEDLSEENRAKLLAYGNDRFEITFVKMKEKASAITNREENRLRCDYFTMTIYYRLFIADLFPEYDKGIYIDSDIVVPGDISELYRIELGENLIGACVDAAVAADAALSGYAAGAVGVDPEHYINSGVLLMNLKQLREKKFSSHFLELLDRYHFYCIAPDQDYLNAICRGKILYLDQSWDVMPGAVCESPKLIHYNLFDKPWCYDNIGYENVFWEYAARTAWHEELLQYKAGYSEEQKASDRSCMEEMIRKAQEVPDMDVTFRKIFESGVRVRL